MYSYRKCGCLVSLGFNDPFNTIKVMSSRSVHLTSLFLRRLSTPSDIPGLVHIISPETDNWHTVLILNIGIP